MASISTTTPATLAENVRPAVHFVWFRGNEYLSAVRVWGRPDFIHQGWDRRARREIADCDTVVFAQGPHDQAPVERNFDDIIEPRAQDFGDVADG